MKVVLKAIYWGIVAGLFAIGFGFMLGACMGAELQPRPATDQQITNGTDNATYVTPRGLRRWAQSGLSAISGPHYTVGTNGEMFTDIQSALNAAFIADGTATNGNPKGAFIDISRGIYNSNGPPLYLSNTAIHAIVLQGSGEISTAIHGASNVLLTVGNIGDPEGARFHLYVRDLALIADQNTTNPIVRFDEAAVRDFQNVYFSYNGYITNTQWGISTAPSLPDPINYTKNVYGVHMANTDENNTWFRYCHFNGLADGIYGGAAHLFVVGCQFQFIGSATGRATNGFPITDARSVGGCVVMDSMSFEGHIENCSFVQSRNSVALLNSIGGQFIMLNNYYETGGGVINDDTGAPLQIYGAVGLLNAHTVTPLDYSALAGPATLLTLQSGLYTDNVGLSSNPFWSLWFNGSHQIQMLSDYSWRVAGNFAVASGSTYRGDGNGLTNLQSDTITATNLLQNTVYTNSFGRAELVRGMALLTITNASAGRSELSILADQTGGSSFAYLGGCMFSNVFQSSSQQPFEVLIAANARFYLTNTSTSNNLVTIVSGTGQRFPLSKR